MYDFMKDHGKSNRELCAKYLMLARKREEQAIMRKTQIKEKATREINDRYPKLSRVNKNEFDERVTALTDIYCFGSKGTPGDPRYNGYIQENQWYTRYATMYASAATADEIRDLHETMKALTRYLRGAQS